MTNIKSANQQVGEPGNQDPFQPSNLPIFQPSNHPPTPCEPSSLQSLISNLKWDERGLVPAIVQDSGTGQVLTLAYMNAQALRLTLETGETWFWSRSRGELWHKGATSGNTQRVVEVRVDCDQDALLVHVVPAGPACHTGQPSCFYRTLIKA